MWRLRVGSPGLGPKAGQRTAALPASSRPASGWALWHRPHRARALPGSWSEGRDLRLPLLAAPAGSHVSAAWRWAAIGVSGRSGGCWEDGGLGGPLMRRPRGEPGSRAPRPTERVTYAGPGESCRVASAGRAAGGWRELVLAAVATGCWPPRAGAGCGGLSRGRHRPRALADGALGPRARPASLRCVLISLVRRLRQRGEDACPRSRSW